MDELESPPLPAVRNMFWGVILRPDKRYEQTVEESFHVSKACLQLSSVENATGFMSVFVEVGGEAFIICNVSAAQPDSDLDLNFGCGEKVVMRVEGTGTVHISGYVHPPDDDAFEDVEYSPDGSASGESVSVAESSQDESAGDDNDSAMEVSPEVVTESKKKRRKSDEAAASLKPAEKKKRPEPESPLDILVKKSQESKPKRDPAEVTAAVKKAAKKAEEVAAAQAKAKAKAKKESSEDDSSDNDEEDEEGKEFFEALAVEGRREKNRNLGEGDTTAGDTSMNFTDTSYDTSINFTDNFAEEEDSLESDDDEGEEEKEESGSSDDDDEDDDDETPDKKSKTPKKSSEIPVEASSKDEAKPSPAAAVVGSPRKEAKAVPVVDLESSASSVDEEDAPVAEAVAEPAVQAKAEEPAVQAKAEEKAPKTPAAAEKKSGAVSKVVAEPMTPVGASKKPVVAAAATAESPAAGESPAAAGQDRKKKKKHHKKDKADGDASSSAQTPSKPEDKKDKVLNGSSSAAAKVSNGGPKTPMMNGSSSSAEKVKKAGPATPSVAKDGGEKKKEKKEKESSQTPAKVKSAPPSAAATPAAKDGKAAAKDGKKTPSASTTPAPESAATPAAATPGGKKSAAGTPKTPKRTIKGGIVIEDLKEGNGPEAKSGKKIGMFYEGKLKATNKRFDVCQGGKPFTFKLGAGDVIKGWDLGIEGMKVGGKRRLTIPPKVGYGEKGKGKDIPPNATLVFDVECKTVN